MRIKPSYLIIAALAAGSIPAHAAASSSSTQASETKTDSAAAKEKKICKRLEISGSRLAERVCLTKAQWKEVETN